MYNYYYICILLYLCERQNWQPYHKFDHVDSPSDSKAGLYLEEMEYTVVIPSYNTIYNVQYTIQNTIQCTTNNTVKDMTADTWRLSLPRVETEQKLVLKGPDVYLLRYPTEEATRPSREAPRGLT